MKLSREEWAERWASFRKMTLPQKLEYIFTYFRLPIVVTLAALIVTGDFAWRAITKKEVLLYSACVNVTMGETLDGALTTGFVLDQGMEPKKAEVTVYRDLYLARDPSAEDHQYAYATRMKLLASIQAQELDVVLMDREAYDILSGEGYLYDIPSILDRNDPLYPRLEPYLTENTVILEDNAVEYNLNEADTYEAVTETVVNGLDVSSFPLFQNAGFSGSVYLGVVGNSPRLPMVFRYLEYLATP